MFPPLLACQVWSLWYKCDQLAPSPGSLNTLSPKLLPELPEVPIPGIPGIPGIWKEKKPIFVWHIGGVCGWGTQASTCRTRVYMCLWRPVIEVQCLPQSLFTLCLSLPTTGSPVLTSKELGLSAEATSLAFMGVWGSKLSFAKLQGGHFNELSPQPHEKRGAS